MEILALVDRQTRQNINVVARKIGIKKMFKQLISKHDKSNGPKMLLPSNNKPISKKLNIF